MLPTTQAAQLPLDLIYSIDLTAGLGIQDDATSVCTDGDLVWISDGAAQKIWCFGLSNSTHIPNLDIDVSDIFPESDDDPGSPWTKQVVRGMTDHGNYLYVIGKNHNYIEVYTKQGNWVQNQSLHANNDYAQDIATDGTHLYVIDYHITNSGNPDLNPYTHIFKYTINPLQYVDFCNFTALTSETLGYGISSYDGYLYVNEYNTNPLTVYRLRQTDMSYISSTNMQVGTWDAVRGWECYDGLFYMIDTDAANDYVRVLTGYNDYLGYTTNHANWADVSNGNPNEYIRGSWVNATENCTMYYIGAYLKNDHGASLDAKAAIYWQSNDTLMAESPYTQSLAGGSGGDWYYFPFYQGIDLTKDVGYYITVYGEAGVGVGSDIQISYLADPGVGKQWFWEAEDNFPTYPNVYAPNPSQGGWLSLYLGYVVSEADEYTVRCELHDRAVSDTSATLSGMFHYEGTYNNIQLIATCYLYDSSGTLTTDVEYNDTGIVSFQFNNLISDEDYSYRFELTRLNLTSGQSFSDVSEIGYFTSGTSDSDFEWREEWTFMFCLGVTLFFFLLPTLIASKIHMPVPPIINVFSGFFGMIALAYFGALPAWILYICALALGAYIVHLIRRT